MTIQELAEALNEQAIDENYKIAELPALRKLFLHKQILPEAIFSAKTIFDGVDKYAFHHGGRDEMQFNVGEEMIAGKKNIRYGLCFSLEPSISLTDPIGDLGPFRKRYNDCIEAHPEMFDGFEMWYYLNGIRHGNYPCRAIPDSWFQPKAFICLGNLLSKPLEFVDSNAVEIILQGFDKLLPIYHYVVLRKPNTGQQKKIFTRLTSNENGWQLPSGHPWKKASQKKNTVPFENQYGFGHEEWLLNQRFKIGGYQYGFIRGIQDSAAADLFYDEVHLFTVKKHRSNNLVYYVGVIKNVWVIKNDAKEQTLIRPIVEAAKFEIAEEILVVKGDVQGTIDYPFQALVKFTLGDVNFYEQPIFQPDFDLYTFKRFKPYKFEGSIEDVFTLPLHTDSLFVSGKAKQTNIYNRKNRESFVTIERLHTEILEALEIFLRPKFSLDNNNISIETMRFQGNIADLVTIDNMCLTIFEVKTGSSGRRNLRDALSQLLDYALHAGKWKINKLVIVSPSKLNGTELKFFNKIHKVIDFEIEYLCYYPDEDVKFK